MITTRALSLALTACALLSVSGKIDAAGDPDRGAQLFRMCAGCHSLEPGRHRAGPSLANIFGREAGTVEGFIRYSDALDQSQVVWNEETLDAWLEEPDDVIPGNLMPFPGIDDAQARADLVAFLKQASAGDAHRRARQPGGMGGMMGAPRMTDLQELPQGHQVTGIRYCRDSYFVTVATGETVPFWEFNLRFKTDSGPGTGPAKGKPVIIGAGMRGDRAFVVFAAPEEISPFIERRCE